MDKCHSKSISHISSVSKLKKQQHNLFRAKEMSKICAISSYDGIMENFSSPQKRNQRKYFDDAIYFLTKRCPIKLG